MLHTLQGNGGQEAQIRKIGRKKQQYQWERYIEE